MVVAVTTLVALVVKYEVLEDVLDGILRGQPLMGAVGVKETDCNASRS